MEKIEVLDILKSALSYSCEDPENILEKGYAKADFNITYQQFDGNNDIKIAKVYFELLLNSTELSAEENSVKRDEIDAFINFTYNVIVGTEMEINEIDDEKIYFIVEPYIRKEVFDFCSEVGLPKIRIPHGFWKNEEAE